MIMARYFISKIIPQGSNVYVLFSETNYGNSSSYFRVSNDYGHTFGPIIRFANSTGYLTSSMAAVGNNVYLGWSELENGTDMVYFGRSSEGGAKFETMPLYAFSHPVGVEVAAIGNYVYLAMGDGHEVYFSRSSDGGKTFGPHVDLSVGEPWSQFPIIAASKNHVYLIWNNNYNGSWLYFTKSDDYGSTFTMPVNLAGASHLTFAGDIQADGDSVYVTWQQADIRENIHYSNDLFFSKSDDGGTDFTTPVMISKYAGDSRDPHITLDGKNIYMTFRYQDLGPYNETRMKAMGVNLVRSIDGGNDFMPPVNLSGGIDRGSFSSQWDGLAVSGDNVYMAMTNNTRNGSSAFLLKSSDGGLDFGPPRLLFNSTLYNWASTISSAENNVYLGWEPELPGVGAFFEASNDYGKTFGNVTALNQGTISYQASSAVFTKTGELPGSFCCVAVRPWFENGWVLAGFGISVVASCGFFLFRRLKER